ncbi:MAG: hypothetical protein BRD44_02730 [Bacteroidetes bacterium QS_7_67_15]|nr:MAG: hypothetical protein BRD44_02730 [Bacteroidetes bacterium QS_7_67_15]
MSFLNPWMLMGLAAAAVPIAVHFFNLRRPRRVDFSSLAFVRQVEERTMQRLNIKRWLLLALRVLAVACLALAFARPVLSPEIAGTVGAPASGNAAMSVVVDNSLSMTRRSGGEGPLLEQAKARAAALAGQMQPGDDLRLSATAGRGDGSTGRASYRNAGAAQEAVKAVEAHPGAEPLVRTARRAARRLASADRAGARARELYLFTDLQKSTLADTLAESTDAEANDNLRVGLVPVGGGGAGEASSGNVAVTDVTVESRIVEVGQPARLTATLRNVGDETLEGYRASVYLGEERSGGESAERLAQATADLAPGERRTVSFTVTPRRRGWLAGRVETEGGDGFPADDARHFILHVPRERRVLIVRGQDQPAEYVELALASGGADEGGSVFQTQTLGAGQLAGTNLSTYDAVVLVGPQSLASGTRQALARYVDSGGGLLLFPGSGMARADYNALLDRLGGGEITGVSGGSGDGEGTRRPIASFERVDTDHPLFEGVFDQARSQRVERPTLYRVADYAARSGAEQALIQLSNGRPFLQEIRHGQGGALFMAAAPNERWSDLPTRGLFVPLLYRSLFYLSASGSTAGDALIAGRAGELRVRGGGRTGSDGSEREPLRLVGPEGQEVIPPQRRLFGATLIETSGQLRTPGVYDVRRGDRLVRRVARRSAPTTCACSLARTDGAALRARFAPGARGWSCGTSSSRWRWRCWSPRWSWRSTGRRRRRSAWRVACVTAHAIQPS